MDKVIKFYQEKKEEKSTDLLKNILNLKNEQLGCIKVFDFNIILKQADVKNINMKERLQLKLMKDTLNIEENNLRKKII